MQTLRVVACLVVGLCSVGIGIAQEEKEQADAAKIEQSGAAQSEAEKSEADLAQQARDPTATITMLQVVVAHNPGFHNLEGADQTRLIVQPIIPVRTGKLQHIVRITLPTVLAGPDWGLLAEDQGNAIPPNFVPTADKTGLGDTALFDLLIFPAPWKGGKIAAGLSAILPTASDPALGTEKWSVGPAFGVLHQSGKALMGAILLANFSVAGKDDRDDVRSGTFQPIASYGLSNGWSLETSEMMFNYDFNSNQWGTLPLGLRIGKMTKFGKLSVRLYGDAEYNFADKGVSPDWTFRFAVVPLL